MSAYYLALANIDENATRTFGRSVWLQEEHFIPKACWEVDSVFESGIKRIYFIREALIVKFNYITISLYHYITISLYHYISISPYVYIIIYSRVQ